MKRQRSAAVITIRNADSMTLAGRKAIATWLRNHAKWLLKDGHEYAPRFTGRYLYR